MLGKFSQILLVVCLLYFANVNAQEEVIGDVITKVEQAFLEKSGLELKYPDEKVPVIVTTNFIELGKLTALRFIEWLLANPNGVVSLPSGTTAEYFIKYLTYYKHNWHSQKVQKELASFGIQSEKFPNTENIKFVQQGDYYPMSPKHIKSDANYIKKFYIDLLELKTENVLLMDITSKGILAEKDDKLIFHNGKVDLSIINKQPQTSLQKWQKQAIQEAIDFCTAYEEKIRSWGGIGFFLTGIGFDGHVSFNLPGSEKNSRTRLVKLNYVAAANASIDLGGIEYARDKGAITIGIDTIKFNKNATYIVFASGVTKSKYIRDLVEGNQDVKMPASWLQDLKNIKVYVTNSSSGALGARKIKRLKDRIQEGWKQNDLDDVVIRIALKENKKIIALSQQDLVKYVDGELLVRDHINNLPQVLLQVKQRIVERLERNIQDISNKKILHTAPHPDDITLAYYPLLSRLSNDKNYFSNITSGFNAVSDRYLMSVLQGVNEGWIDENRKILFHTSELEVINEFNKYYYANEQQGMHLQDTILNLKNVINLYGIKDTAQLKNKLRWFKDEYFPSKLLGDVDDVTVQMLKGMVRETENKKLLSSLNMNYIDIINLRSKFYTAETFKNIEHNRQYILPIIYMYNVVEPDIITIYDALPGTRPFTNFVVKQILANSLAAKKNIEHIKIWGYRSIWYKYDVSVANIFIPVSKKEQIEYKKKYKNYFASQKDASYPSPFSTKDFATTTIIEQHHNLIDLKILLGKKYFSEHKDPRIKHAIGIIYMREMPAQEFIKEAQKFKIDNSLELSMAQIR